MKRRYFIADDLSSIKQLENILLANHFESAQLHVYSWNDKLIDEDHYNYHEINDFQKRNVWRSGLRGLTIGLVVATIMLAIVYAMDFSATPAGWIPFIFLAIAAIGFFTWEGGLHGIQEHNQEFSQFMEALKNDKHVFFVDFTRDQENILNEAVNAQKELVQAKDSSGPPAWMINGQTRLEKMIEALP